MCTSPCRFCHFRLVALGIALTGPLPADDSNELSRQATDPTASLMALNFLGLYVGDYHGPTPPGQPDDQFTFQFRPVIAYQLGNGWSLSAGDFQFSYDWKDGRWLNIPIGFQIGKVARFGRQPMRFAVNPQYNLADDDFFPEWSVTFTVTTLFPSR